MDYHKRPEWSYSDMKIIVKSGIDYAMAVKQGMIEQKFGKAVDIGQLAHDEVLRQGGANQFVIKAYPDYRTKEAREWRDSQTLPIISEEEFEQINAICEAIKTHPLYSELLCGEGIENEVEMYAKINGVDIRGKADAVKKLEGGLIITDLKTTADFDGFCKNAWRFHYDLQDATYTLLGRQPETTNYYFVIAETVAPYRVGIMHASLNFLESGERKLSNCIQAIKDFGNRAISFHLNKTWGEIGELGDLSL